MSMIAPPMIAPPIIEAAIQDGALSPCNSRDYIIQITSLSICTIVIVLYLALALALALAHSNSTIDNWIICYMEKEPKMGSILLILIQMSSISCKLFTFMLSSRSLATYKPIIATSYQYTLSLFLSLTCGSRKSQVAIYTTHKILIFDLLVNDDWQ